MTDVSSPAARLDASDLDAAIATFDDAFATAQSRVDDHLDRFGEAFPGAASEDGTYPETDAQSGWTPSFWTGSLWLLYDCTGRRRYREAAIEGAERFVERLETRRGVRTHDLGFLYQLSTTPAAELLDGQATDLDADRAADCSATAAELLADRFHPLPGIVQAWGDPEDPEADWPGEWGYGRTIVDTMMNLPLLFWVANRRDDRYLRHVAVSHANATADHAVRDDGSTFHTYAFDPETGAALGGETHQGHADDSCWARGQTWTLYGMALASRYTGHDRFLDCAESVAAYYADELPDDLVPYWDLDFGAGSGEPRDSSAAAIAACGLLELADQLPPTSTARREYETLALRTVESLAESYALDQDADHDGLLAHGTYDYPSGNGIDEAVIWGDYFYLEALARATEGWECFW